MPRKPDPARPEVREFNVRPRRVSVMHPDETWHLSHWYERLREDPALPEVHVYTDALSYAPGDEVAFHAFCNAASWTLQVWRDGARPELVHESADPARLLRRGRDPKRARPLHGAGIARRGHSPRFGCARRKLAIGSLRQGRPGDPARRPMADRDVHSGC